MARTADSPAALRSSAAGKSARPGSTRRPGDASPGASSFGSSPCRNDVCVDTSMRDLTFDNTFVRDAAGRSGARATSRGRCRHAAYSRVEPTPVAAPTAARRGRDEVGELLGLDAAARRAPDSRRRCSPATACCRACSRTPRATAGTSSATGPASSATAARSRSARSSARDGAALGAAAQGRGADAVLAHRRRPRGAALVGARVPVQRGDAPPRRADHARARASSATGETGRARHVLRRPSRSPSRARSSAASRRRSCASATSRSSPRAARLDAAAAARRLRDPHALPRARRALAARRTRAGSTRSAGAPPC